MYLAAELSRQLARARACARAAGLPSPGSPKATATTVTAKATSVEATGLHSPVLTNGGFPIVDGVVTSFDSIDKVTLAKHGLAPLLKACKATGTCETVRNMFFTY